MATDAEARDAYLGVEVDLPNGAKIIGKPVPFPDAMRMMLQSEQYYAGATLGDSVVPMLTDFARITGVTQDKLLALCPDLTLGEVVNLVQRFFFWRRNAATGAPGNPPASPSPSGA
jgi:hypothetical protein